MVVGGPVGFEVLNVVFVASDDLGELFIAPPSSKSVFGLFDKNPVTGFLAIGGHVPECNPAGWNGSGRDAREGYEHNYESEDIS